MKRHFSTAVHLVLLVLLLVAGTSGHISVAPVIQSPAHPHRNMEMLQVTIDNVHNSIVLNEELGIERIKILYAYPRRGFDFNSEMGKTLNIRIYENSNPNPIKNEPIYPYVKRKKKRIAQFDDTFSFSSFKTLKIEVYDPTELVPFMVDVVIMVY